MDIIQFMSTGLLHWIVLAASAAAGSASEHTGQQRPARWQHAMQEGVARSGCVGGWASGGVDGWMGGWASGWAGEWLGVWVDGRCGGFG